MRNPFAKTVRAVKSTEASLQKFGKRIRNNLKENDELLAQGKIGRNQYVNPFRKPKVGDENALRGAKMSKPGVDESVARAAGRANRTKKK